MSVGCPRASLRSPSPAGLEPGGDDDEHEGCGADRAGRFWNRECSSARELPHSDSRPHGGRDRACRRHGHVAGRSPARWRTRPRRRGDDDAADEQLAPAARAAHARCIVTARARLTCWRRRTNCVASGNSRKPPRPTGVAAAAGAHERRRLGRLRRCTGIRRIEPAGSARRCAGEGAGARSAASQGVVAQGQPRARGTSLPATPLRTWRNLLAVVPVDSSDARIIEANIAEATRLAASQG